MPDIEKDEQKINVHYKSFFGSIRIISITLAIAGIIAAIAVFLTSGNIYNAIALIFLLTWIIVFLRYFLWSLYHYNVNFGLTQKDWDSINANKIKLLEGKEVLKADIVEPQHNPFRSQTFGLPPGTVRGMIAFTLLFGAITLLIVSMGMDKMELENSLIRDQFEFFKTAFLMMIAFYFGDKSLKYLQKRWQTPSDSLSRMKKNNLNKAQNANASHPKHEFENSELTEDDINFQKQDDGFEEGTDEFVANLPGNQSMTVLKEALSIKLENNEVDMPEENIVSQKQRIPIIDCGHGGIDENGEYTTKNAKQYAFTGEDQKGLSRGNEIFEGEINRKIGIKLIEKLKVANMSYVDLNSTDPNDMSLKSRVHKANALYDKNKSYYYLSIHSNSASKDLSGKGTTAHGFEIFTSKGTTTSDLFAKIASEAYKKHFPERRFRGIKEANYYVLKYTNCPAFLVENLFFDNYDEALFLDSEKGQEAIANCIFEAIQNIT